MGQVINFPREIVVEQKIRDCRQMIEKLLGYIEAGESETCDLTARLRAATAPDFLEMWQEDLRKALAEREMLTADDAMRFGGLLYRAQPSQNGAH